jgi:hypothetical protein
MRYSIIALSNLFAREVALRVFLLLPYAVARSSVR